jgi:hypothetical protein
VVKDRMRCTCYIRDVQGTVHVVTRSFKRMRCTCYTRCTRYSTCCYSIFQASRTYDKNAKINVVLFLFPNRLHETVLTVTVTGTVTVTMTARTKDLLSIRENVGRKTVIMCRCAVASGFHAFYALGFIFRNRGPFQLEWRRNRSFIFGSLLKRKSGD